MPWILQMVGFAILLFGVAIALWVSVWLLLFLFGVGLLVVIWSHIRAFLLNKGIINQMPSGSSPPADSQVVDAEFTHVDAPTLPKNDGE